MTNTDNERDEPSYEELIDVAVLNNLRALRQAQSNDEPDVLDTLVDMFLKDVPIRMEAMDSAIREHDLPQTERLAHSLKGSCASIGARSMATLCGFLESRSAQGLEEGAVDVTDRLKVHFQLVARILNDERTSTSTGTFEPLP